MVNKLFTLLVRGGLTFLAGWIAGASLHNLAHIEEPIPLTTASIIWFIGVVYSLMKFNDSYNILALEKVDDKIINKIDEKNKYQIEKDMLRTKHLFDEGILTQDEYDKKIKILKDKYI